MFGKAQLNTNFEHGYNHNQAILAVLISSGLFELCDRVINVSILRNLEDDRLQETLLLKERSTDGLGLNIGEIPVSSVFDRKLLRPGWNILHTAYYHQELRIIEQVSPLLDDPAKQGRDICGMTPEELGKLAFTEAGRESGSDQDAIWRGREFNPSWNGMVQSPETASVTCAEFTLKPWIQAHSRAR
ncbi:hypothetical protein HDU76_000001 [Blyttiomyces sp. JEL0837]|nr:hypothetical protein HDU76_000001 [Blyttiomyces sp. JEL0837]